MGGLVFVLILALIVGNEVRFKGAGLSVLTIVIVVARVRVIMIQRCCSVLAGRSIPPRRRGGSRAQDLADAVSHAESIFIFVFLLYATTKDRMNFGYIMERSERQPLATARHLRFPERASS